MMKKFFFTLFALIPFTLWAQDNSWEINEDEDVKPEVTVKTKVDPKYLKGQTTRSGYDYMCSALEVTYLVLNR